MSKNYGFKLPDGLAAAFDEKIARSGLTSYAFLQALALKEISMIPAIPKKKVPPIPRKPPPIPKKPRIVQATRPIFDVIPRLNAWVLNGAPRDEVWDALVREATAALDKLEDEKPSWCPRDRYQELCQILSDLDIHGHPMDTYAKGCLRAIEEDFRASLPRLTMRKPTPVLPKSEPEEDDFAMELVLGAAESLGSVITTLTEPSPFEGGGGDFGGGGSSGEW